jgi:hypothetical protein
MNRSKINCLLFSMIALAPAAGISQIANVEVRRIAADSNGFAGHTDLLFLANKSQFRLLTFGTDARVQYRKNQNRFLLLGNMNYTRAQFTDYLNDGFVHFRYTRQLKPALGFESFTQYQYNHLLLLNHRTLIGGGPRLKVLNKPKTRVFTGFMTMYEREVLKTQEPVEHNLRESVYVAWTLSTDSRTSFNGTMYYQPLLRDFSDFRVAGQYNLILFMGRRLYLKNTLNYMHDSRPPEGAVHTVYNYMAGLGYLFR